MNEPNATEEPKVIDLTLVRQAQRLKRIHGALDRLAQSLPRGYEVYPRMERIEELIANVEKRARAGHVPGEGHRD